MSRIYGFIGAGNMGGALAKAAAKKIPAENILISNRTLAKAEALAAALGAKAVSNAEAAEKAYFIFLGVKPQMLAALFDEIRPVLAARETPYVLVSMAAGVSIEKVRALAGEPSGSASGSQIPVIRIMPNTPCSIGKGVTLYNIGKGVSAEDAEIFLSDMQSAGGFVELDEALFDAGCAVSGCGPAYVDLFMEALADGGVACGLPRAAALKLAAQTVSGSAELLLASGKSPAELKDAVCSPGGATIQGVRALEKAGFRSAVIDAVAAACERSKQLG